MSDKFFYVLMVLVAFICVDFGWGNEHGYLGNLALVIGGVFAGVLIADMLNEGDAV
jgi:hypothetical protein